MDQYKMNANFRPAPEPKNGHIGYADVTIADAIKIYDISVFQKKDGTYNFHFPDFPLADGKHRHGFVVAENAEARAQFLDVIVKAVNDQEHHFGWATGKQNPFLSVSGRAVQEAHADARFTVKVGDLCTLCGIKTEEVNFKKENEEPGKFVAVNFPLRKPYEKEGETVYPHVFEALKDGKAFNKETGKEEPKDFEALLNNLIRGERKNVLEKKTALNDKIADASQKAGQADPGKDAPAQEVQR